MLALGSEISLSSELGHREGKEEETRGSYRVSEPGRRSVGHPKGVATEGGGQLVNDIVTLGNRTTKRSTEV